MENNKSTKSPWDAARIREGFQYAANDAERYWNEIYPKVPSQPSYKHLVDEMVAKFYVYDALAARAWNTAPELVKAACELLEVEICEQQMFDHQRVKQHHERFLKCVIDQYQD
jgi:hypothetical protein